RRIRYLQKRLPDLKIVEQKPANSEIVYFGASVTLEDESGTAVTYRIVGPDEFDRAEHYISVDSPLARSLLKHELGEEIEVDVPSGRKVYIIAGIEY
ncbi:MAG: GreA/GreB family elongation factor, partial [Gammaproteobacteria bacterium]